LRPTNWPCSHCGESTISFRLPVIDKISPDDVRRCFRPSPLTPSYTNIMDVDGGFNAWQAAGYEFMFNQ
jgi:hypothetical protein